jgi:hypothetical protein
VAGSSALEETDRQRNWASVVDKRVDMRTARMRTIVLMKDRSDGR